MEEEISVKLISVSDLLHRLHPITGASSLSLRRSSHRSTLHEDTTQPSNPQSPNNYKILKPLDYPALLIGTLTLTSPSFSCSNSSCLKFSDNSAAVCCDILDLDLRVIGQRIRVVAWNFLPLKPHGGYLEIIRWTLDHPEKDSISNFNAFYLDSLSPAYEQSRVPRHLVYGLLESVSPVTNVPCTANKSGTRNLNGFLAEITICECKLCCTRDSVMLLQDITGEQNNGHNFSKPKILYFCGSAFIWYPAISRLVGGNLLISGLKKKMVFLGQGKSLMMYVTTEKAMIHLPMSPSKSSLNRRNTTTREKGLCGAHTGSITGVYMQGMVIELDQNILILLTDHQLAMPHGLRVGAIVTVRNFHLDDPKFLWTKIKIFGSCYKTSIRVNIFSPIESGCYQALQSRSLLRKFIESLAFSARLWVLLVVSSLKKKFAGVLSEMEILGSKHMEGLVQKYSSSCLPLSVFRFRHGVLTEYCQHELCGCGKVLDYNPPKLVVPISNLISQCENKFIKFLNARVTDPNMNHQYCNFVCGGKSHDQPIRKILKSEDMNVVLLGTLKISEYSGRLQLIDATGSIDIVIPDLPSVCSIKDIYEINNFSVVMEGFPRQLKHLESLEDEPFSCGNIFGHFQLARRKRFTIYIYCYMRDAKSRNHILCPSMDGEDNLKELESGRFHLLWLMHKFPVQQKFPGDDTVSNSSSIYAEAIVLPWNLVLHEKERDVVESYAGVSDAGSNLSEHLQFSYGDDQQSYDKKWCDLSCLQEFPCTIDCRVSSDKSMVSLGIFLNCTVANMQEDSFCKRDARKLLLEFKSDSFLKYELLRIGGYYLIKHHNKDMACTAKDSGNTCDGKVLVDSKSHLWSVSFSADEAGPSTAQSCICSYHNLNGVGKKFQSPNCCQVEIPVLRSTDGRPEICPDIYLHLSADHLSFLEVKLRKLKEDLIQPTNSIKGLFNNSWIHRTMKSASMLSGAFGVNLPEGNLLSVQGHVVAVHSSDQGSLVTHLSHKIFHGAHRRIIPGVTNSVCIHVLVDHDIVKIYSGLSEQSYPIGFGPGIKANFHRVLLTDEGDVLKLTPASFIEINSIVVDDDLCSNDLDDTSSVLETTSSLPTAAAALISEIMQFPDQKQIRLHCEVVAIYVLVVEKSNELLQSSTVNSKIPSVKFPLAGFIMDDGSSSCCCWSDNERALTLLGLHEWLSHKHFRGSLHKSNKEIEILPCSYTLSRMSKILGQHGTVVIKNYGSVSDSSCLDVALLVNSDSFVRESDEEFLKSLILQACSSKTWNVVGTVLDTKGVDQLEERLQRLDMMMPPLQHIWISEVSHLDTLNEGRSILQELLKSK
ncbi:CST complex subunit CTC1 [Cynara cardunculus var. scolymus]|uniref:CST complex subunit CTC1 n=1 Tax=Cynara cardunculus var. scolymus TaxID=59895 RepID=UPI000D62E5CF|nr:CST complex subunit CTC1 [Cynara cardunculus var. scolymus]